MLTVFEYIKDQFMWLFVMGWHLVRYMGVGGRWMIMALRLIVYGLLITPSFAPHILWYMGSSTVIRRVRYRSSRKVKLEIVKALLHWRAAAENGDDIDDYYDDRKADARIVSPTTADHKNVSDWIEQSIAKKESAPTPTPTVTNPAAKNFTKAVKGATERDERKSAMIELLSDKHNQAQAGSNLQPDASLVKSHKSEIEKSNAAFLLRSIRTKLSFTDAILTQQDVDDGLEAPALQKSSVEKITSVVVPIQNPKDTITSSTTRVQKQTQNGGKSKHGLTSSPLTIFPKLGESRISRVFGDDDEDELGIGQQPQLLASVNLLQQRAATIGAQHQQQMKALPTPRNVAQNKELSGFKNFGNPKVASSVGEPQQLVMDDSDQDTLLFNYFQIFCDAYYKKKEDIKKRNKKSGTKSTTLPTTNGSVSPSPSTKQTTETFTSVMDPDILGLAKESLSVRDQLSQTLNPVELGLSSGAMKSASKPPTVEEPDNQFATKEASSFGTNPFQSRTNPVSPAMKNMKVATDNSSFYSGLNDEEGRAANINDVEGGEVSAATTPTKPIKPTIDVPPIPSPADTEPDFESESEVLDAFLEWVEEQCDSEDVRVHNRATLDVFVPIPLHDLLALRSSKQKQSQSPASLARAVADTPQDLSDDNGKCDMKAPKPASPPPTNKAPAQLKALMKGEAKPFKVCIMVSGGAWIIGCYLWSAILARFFAAAGYVVFVPDYRNFPQAAISGMVEDVTDAIVWVLKNAEIYNGDLSNVTLIGHSAGAHLSLLTILEQCRACQVQEELQRQNQQAEADQIASVSPSMNTGIQSDKKMPTVSSGKLSDAFGETTVSEPGSGYGQIPTPVASAPGGNGTWSPSFESPQITPTTFSNLTTSFGNRSMLAVFNDLKHERSILKKTTNTPAPGSALGAATGKTTFSPSVTPAVSPRNLSSARQETRSPSREGAKPCSPPTVALDLSANYHPPLPTSFHNNTKPRFNPNTAITQWIGVSGIYDLPSLEGHFNKRGLYSKVLYALAGYWGDPSDGANRDTAIKDGAEVQRIKNKQQQEQDQAKLKAVADGTVDPTMLMKKSVKQSPLSQTVSGVFPPSASSNELDDNILQGQGTTTTPGGQRRSAEGFETPLKALRRVSPWWMFVKEVPIKSPRPPRHHKLGDFPRKIINESLAKISTYALFTPSSPLSDWSIDSSSPAAAATTLVPDSTLVPYLPLNLKFLHGTEDDSAPLEESAAMVKVISEAIIDYVSSPPIDQQKKDGTQTVNYSSRRSPAPAIQNVVFLRASHTDPILEEILCGKCTVLEIAERRHHIGSSCPPRRREEQQMDERAESENKLSNYFFKFSSSLYTVLLAALMLPYVWGVRVFSFVFGNPAKQTNNQDKNQKSPGNKLKEDKKSAFKQTSPEHHSPANSSTSSLPLAHTSPGVPSYYETSLAVDKANMPRLVRWARKICPF